MEEKNKPMPLVSVVIPVYNMETFLAETLDSVLASDYPAFEVVVMDDGSKDTSLSLARKYAEKDDRVRVFTQQNAGACAARNQAIAEAWGEFILPVDADNTIEPSFIREAVGVFLREPDVKVVAPRADFFGAKRGEWKLPPFSLSLLARKNIMDTCAMYRKSDWVRIGGYCEEIIAREDWEFWISMLKDGGEVRKLPSIVLHYRVRETSKRVSDRTLKRHVVEVLNRRHPEFFERELGGPLRYRRSWSRVINRVVRLTHPRKVWVDECYSSLKDWVKVLPIRFATGDGRVIYRGRNELREFSAGGKDFVVKSFRLPNCINRVVYGFFRSSKAQRSYEYAKLLLENGIGTPVPVGYYTERNGFLFGKSYYVSEKSACPYTYAQLQDLPFAVQERVLKAIARTTARLHDRGFLHKDYSRGNILFSISDEEVKVEIIDLNRIRFCKIGQETGCKNFERLPGTKAMFKVLADEYAKARGFEARECLDLILKYNTAAE